MKKTLSQRFFLPLCLLTLFGILGGSHAWAENFSQTYSYGLTGWSLTNYSDASSYYLIPNSGNESVATIPRIFTGKTISSAVKITINSATYGNGTNPSSSTYAIYSDANCTTTTAVAATKSGKLPTSSTYTNVIYTVSQADASAFTKDLAIKFTKPGKQIRLKSIKIEFSYSSGGGETGIAPTISTQPQDAIYELNATAAPLTIEASGIPAPTFQWYSNTENNNTTGATITGATEPNYTPATTTSGTVYYYCIATNTQGSVTSDVATVTVKPPFSGSVLTMSGANDANIKFVKGASNSEEAVWSNSTPLSYNGITLSGGVTSGSNYSYYDDTQVRFYTDNNLVITPASGITIEKIEIVRISTTGSNSGTISCSGLTASSENTTTNTNVFIGNATTAVTFTASAQSRFTEIKVYYSGSAAGIVNPPVFNLTEGTYFEAQTVKVKDYDNGLKYYYTIDGTDPELNASFQPTGTTQPYNDETGVSISSTTTLKMIATYEANVSSITTATYKFPDATSIMALRSLGAGTHSIMLTDAIVTYVNGKNGFVQDATGGLMLYATNTLKVGDKISGPVDVVLVDYKGTDEATTFDVSAATITSNNPLPLTTLTIQDLITGDGIKTYESMRVKITDVVVKDAIVSRNGTISKDDSSIALREGVSGCLSTTYMMNVNSMGNVIGYPVTYTSGENTTLQLSVMSADAVEETGYNLVVSPAGYATYFNFTEAFTMPTGATGYVWDEGNIVAVYNSAQVVPANEPLVIEAPAGNYALWFTTSKEETWKSAGMNALEGTDVATDIPEDNDYYFYGLSLNASSDPASVGFYWMNPTGAAFTNGAHKAYLKLAKSTPAGSQAVNGFPFNGTTTGIEQIEAGADAKNAIYDLSGRRVNKAAKGIYILNGKKVLVK